MFSKLNFYSLLRPKVLAGVATILAICVSSARGIENLGVNDASGYIDQAKGVFNGSNYVFTHPESFGHGLAFSLVIALTFFLTNTQSLFLFKIILAIGHGLSTWLVAKIGISLGLERKFWVCVAFFFAIDPFILSAATDIQTESLVTLVVLYWAYVYLIPFQDLVGGKWHILLYSFSGIYITLIRPNFLVVFLAITFLVFRKWYNVGITLRFLSIGVSIFLILLSIYEIFLTKLNSGFVFLANYGGLGVAYLCRKEFVPQYLGIASSAQNAEINNWVTTIDPLSNQILARNPGASSAELNSELYRIGISNCLSNPIESAWLLILKSFAVWRPTLVFGAYGSEIFFFSLLLWLPLTVILIWFISSRKLKKKANELRVFFLVGGASFTFSVLMTTSTHTRHRIAFAESFYWLFFFFWLQKVLAQRQKKSL